MWISHAIWPSRLPWSEPICTHHLNLVFRSIIHTNLTCEAIYDSETDYRLRIISALKKRLYTNSQVATILNGCAISTPTGKSYNGKLVWATYKKYSDKTQRKYLQHTSVSQIVSLAVKQYGTWFAKESNIDDIKVWHSLINKILSEVSCQ